ncbi:sodium/proton antiporter (CPA1 family) [Paucimonas lemoignei]|uniref:Sodium/proton antiporter (CPA1 family) n=1 Tax=Paucimonas lemoignei TaxID=29443 RepID=A0A4R3HV81_PAULE|nr:Na+/H+ antiporter [Paucimonas lemoignei]TCS35965.1 sodium/proton antiporter (CPA1 family) [Paucimonas lemoignei]
MESIEIVLAMLLAVVASGYLVRALPISLPLPLVQIALGAVISGVFKQGVILEPHIFFLLFLPPLLFLDGWRIPKDGLFRDKATILELAFGLVIFTVLGIGLLVHWMIPSMPLPVAFALAAIVSPTDPVAVSSITTRVPIPRRLMHILEGESLLNDASGLVCFRFAVAAAMTGSFSLASASLTFLWVALAGLGIGAGITMGISIAQRWLSHHFGEDDGSSILVSLLTPFAAYLAAETLQASGILAAVAAGVTMSYVELTGRALATTRLHRSAVWDTVQFSLNGIMFVLLGEQLPGIVHGAMQTVETGEHLAPVWLFGYALAICLGLIVLRFIWVWASLRLTLFRRQGENHEPVKSHWRLLLATSVAGVRGAITLAGVLTLPLLLPDGTPFPARDLAIFLATAVILLTLTVASIALPRLLRGLEIPQEATALQEEDLARQHAARAAIAAIERTRRRMARDAADADIHTKAASRVIGVYQHRLEQSAGGEGEANQLRRADQAERTLRLAALEAERNEVFKLAREQRISDATSRKLVREIDLVESRYR